MSSADTKRSRLSPVEDRLSNSKKNRREFASSLDKSKCRVYVSNIPFKFDREDLRELFYRQVGDVIDVQLFYDEQDKFRGAGIIEFASADMVSKAITSMHRYEVFGRSLIVKEDYGVERDPFGHPIINPPSMPTMSSRYKDKDFSSSISLRSNQSHDLSFSDDTSESYGLNPNFLKSLDIEFPLVDRLFVANLDYSISESRLREVFALAGHVVEVKVVRSPEGVSRGYALVQYSHPVEAVQAISMLHGQKYMSRPLVVRMDKANQAADKSAKPSVVLPSGLSSVGIGLGVSGVPLRVMPDQQGGDKYSPDRGSQRSVGGLYFSSPPNSSIDVPVSHLFRRDNDGGRRDSRLSPPMFEPRDLDGRHGGSLRGARDNLPINQVLVTNLDYDCGWRTLKQKFSQVGDVRFVAMKQRGTGVVIFESASQALRAVDVMDGIRWEGRVISVQLLNN